MKHFPHIRTIKEPPARRKKLKCLVNRGLCTFQHTSHCMNSVQQIKFSAPKPHIVSTLNASGISDFQTLSYRLVGAFQVDNTYFELSDESGVKQKIHTDELVGSPTCPCCGNQIGFAMCSCGGIHCIGDEQVSTCPWCGNQGKYGIGEGGFDVNRTQG